MHAAPKVRIISVVMVITFAVSGSGGAQQVRQVQQEQQALQALQALQAQSGTSEQAHTAAVSDAKILADFKAKVGEYDALRKSLAKKGPPLKKTNNPAEIASAEQTLAQQIKAARAGAKRGDIFTPATERLFRRLLNPAFKGDEGVENKTAIKEDAPPAAKIPFQVNADYPKDQPLSTVPPDVLLALPPLPDGVQYRIAGKHLLLYCTQGNLIIDYMLNAIP